MRFFAVMLGLYLALYAIIGRQSLLRAILISLVIAAMQLAYVRWQ